MPIDTYIVTPSEDCAKPISSESSKQATPVPEDVALFKQYLQHSRKGPKFSVKKAARDSLIDVLISNPSVNSSQKTVRHKTGSISRSDTHSLGLVSANTVSEAQDSIKETSGDNFTKALDVASKEEYRHPVKDKRSHLLEENQTHVSIVSLEVLTPVQTNKTTTSQSIETHVYEVMRYIKEQVVSRVLVASSSLEQNRTITLTLSPNLLTDTNVQFSKSGSSLYIQFTSQAQSSLSFLMENQVNLQGYLQTELKPYKYERVSVQVFDGRLSEDSMSKDSRSRGYFAYDSQDNTK